jgi:hypothetical protein
MFGSKRFRIGLLSAFAIAAVVSANGQLHTASAQGQVVAETGFVPKTDSFNFENYGNDTGYANMTAAEVRRMFGDQVCAELNGDTCVLTPPAQEWMDSTNEAMGGGHCDGMATLSSLFYDKAVKLTDFGGSETVDLKIADDPKLQHEIAYWWATQTTSPTSDAEIKLTPTEIINKMIDDTKSKAETYTVGIYQPDGSQGHSITAYGVRDEGDGIFWLMVYDNNYPLEERYIVVDTKADTWRYTTAADPSASENDYTGDATTKTLTLTPDSARLKPQDCPFCQAAASSKAGLAQAAKQYNEVRLNDAETPANGVHLLITDDKGNKLGYEGGKLVNTIPGAKYIALTSKDLWKNIIEPIYEVPTGIQFTVTVDASQLKTAETASVLMIGPGYDLAADNIKLSPGEKDTMTFSPDGKKLSYTPSNSESPDFAVGLTHTGADYAFLIKGFEVDKGASVNVDLEYDKGTLALHTTGNTNPSVYALTVNRIDTKSDETFTHDGITLDPGATAYINFAKWDGKGDLSIDLDKQSDGTIEATTPESNQAK